MNQKTILYLKRYLKVKKDVGFEAYMKRSVGKKFLYRDHAKDLRRRKLRNMNKKAFDRVHKWTSFTECNLPVYIAEMRNQYFQNRVLTYRDSNY